jgi:hypothetical protein
MVRFGRRMQAIDGVGGEVDRCVESKTAGGTDDVVVDRFRYADDRDALLRELMCDGQRPVAADDDEGVEAELVKIFDNARRVVDLAVACRYRISEWISAIGRAEDGSANP